MLVIHPTYVSRQLYKAKWARADDRIHFAGPLDPLHCKVQKSILIDPCKKMKKKISASEH